MRRHPIPRTLRVACVLVLVGCGQVVPVHAPAAPARVALPDPVPCDGCWRPAIDTSWQIQFNGEIDTALDVDMFEVDMFDTTKATVDEFHSNGTRVVCYISGGSWERWRPDKDDFPRSVLGKELDGWPGERWLDIRKLKVLKPLMGARLDLCKEKGFDSAEFDNVNGYQNRTGFPLTGPDQLRYNTWLANAAHERGLSVGLKNEGPQARVLVDYFDWAIVEQCFQYNECKPYDIFISRGKAVMELEYKLQRSEFCPDAERHNFNAMRKHRSLDAYRRPCP